MSPLRRHLAQMPRLTAPIRLGGEIYVCNSQGLHVPLEAMTLEQLRCAICYLPPPPLERKP